MAAAAQAAAIAANPLMDGHLMNVINIDHQPLRAKLILAGFTDEIDTLTTHNNLVYIVLNMVDGLLKLGNSVL